jgi:ribosomal protein L9
MKPGYQTEIERIEEDVRKNFETSKAYKEKLRRAKTVPFKKEEQNFGALGHVESREIFKDLQEISRYLDRKQEQDSKLPKHK